MQFRKGDKVEVLIRTEQEEPIWFPATVLRLALGAARKGQMYVEYDTLLASPAEEDNRRLREYVELADVRPAPPPELHLFFMVGDEVEVFCKARRGWRKAVVSAILENSKYSVLPLGAGDADGDGVEREEEEAEQWGLRVLRKWDDGSWVPPFQHEVQLLKSSLCF